MRALQPGKSAAASFADSHALLAVFDAKSLFLQPPGTQISLVVRKSTGEMRDVAIRLEDFIP